MEEGDDIQLASLPKALFLNVFLTMKVVSDFTQWGPSILGAFIFLLKLHFNILYSICRAVLSVADLQATRKEVYLIWRYVSQHFSM